MKTLPKKPQAEKACKKIQPSFSPQRWERRHHEKLSAWIRAIGEDYQNSELGIEEIAYQLGTSVAELDACLQLNLLSDTTLAKLDAGRPPLSTWHTLAALDEASVPDALKMITEERKDGFSRPMSILLRKAFGLEINPAVKFSKISPEAYAVAAKLAEKNALLNDSSRKALKGFGSDLKRKGFLSIRQGGYAKSLVQSLKDNGLKSTNPKEQSLLDELYQALN